MNEMQIPWERPERIATAAESIAPWVQIRSAQQQQRLGEMRMQQMQQEQARQEQLRGLFANGQRPTADQMYSIDPETGMQYERQQAQNELAQSKAYQQKMAVAKDIATGIRAKVQQSGMDPATPEGQQYLDSITAPYKPVLYSIFGKSEHDGKPVDWNALNAIADMGSAESGYHPPVNSNQGVLQYGPRGWEPIKIGNQVAMPVAADVELTGRNALARSANTIDKVTGPDQRDRYMTKGQAAGIGATQPSWLPVQDVQAEIEQLKQTDPQAATQLQAMADRQPQKGPVMGPTPGEVEKGKQTAKNDAELAQAKQKRLQSVGNMLAMLQKPIQGQDIESLISESTGSGLGATVDNAAQFFGKTTKGAEAIAKLQPVAEWLVSMAPRMEGPQSNFDVERYKAMAGNLGDPTKTPEQRIAAYKSLKGMLEDYLKSDGGDQQPKAGGVKFLGFE